MPGQPEGSVLTVQLGFARTQLRFSKTRGRVRLPSERRLSKFKEKRFASLSARDRKFFPHVSPGPERFQKGTYSAVRKE